LGTAVAVKPPLSYFIGIRTVRAQDIAPLFSRITDYPDQSDLLFMKI